MKVRILAVVLSFVVKADRSQAFVPMFTANVNLRRPMSDSDENGMDSLRNLLDSSWNSQSEGSVPMNLDSAATSAAESIMKAFENEQKAVFFVDLLLPQFDLSQGERMYDEVSAVELCISLARQLEGKTQIIVRNKKTVDNVSRVLEGRLQDMEQDDDEEGMDTIEDDKGGAYPTSGDEQAETEGGEPRYSSEDSVESFRSQLISSWDPLSESENTEAKSKNKEAKKRIDVVPAEQFRLASMLGDTEIKGGADMAASVLKAVAANGRPRKDEDTIIILSAISPEELVGVRALVSKYKATKRIVLVNCRLDPLPRELVDAKSVYSILPLTARQKTGDFVSGSSRSQPDKTLDPRVVVMKTYPKNWEVFVDVGEGFELAATCPASQFKKLPPMFWVAEKVKAFLVSSAG